MFDGPIPHQWRPNRPQPRGSVRVPLFMTFGLLALLLADLARSPLAPVVIFSAPGGLRQIEAMQISPSQVDFFLHDAGFRLRHRLELVAAVYGAPNWSVSWQGENAVTIHLPYGEEDITRGKPANLEVAITK